MIWLGDLFCFSVSSKALDLVLIRKKKRGGERKKEINVVPAFGLLPPTDILNTILIIPVRLAGEL